jgi:predicted acyl esterase
MAMAHMSGHRWVVVITALASSVACSSSDEKASNGADAGAPESTEEADFVAGGSIGQVWVTDATEGDELILVDGTSNEVARGSADRLGSLILRDVEPGPGYTVRRIEGDVVYGTPAFAVLSRTGVPDPSLYDQELVAGLNYVTMRDGIELAMTVRLPSGMALDDGPFPTVIEYSGYQVAAPKDLFEAAVAAVGSGSGLGGLSDPLLPATSTAVGSIIAPLLGYVAVSVQMRGSGCSGGDFQLFDVPTTYDGYDAVEIVAAQPWVEGGKVGLVGISFSGISQLFVGGTRPSSLAAVAPLSVTDDIYTGTGFPGGIFNNGFAASWLNERQENAHPAPEEGAQPYATQLIADGDTHCRDNQKLRLQTQDINALIEDNPFRNPKLIDDRTPANWFESTDVPVFLVGQFQDEQTGGHFPEMLHRLDANPNVWITLQNGAHADSLGPGTITRWAEFLDLFVADRIPVISPTVSALSGELYKAVAAGSPSMPLPPTRFDAFTDVDAARTEFKKDPRVRILFDCGGGDLGPGALQPVWELGFDSWPVQNAVATVLHLGADGVLSAGAGGNGEASYLGDPSLRPRTTLGGSGLSDPWAALPSYDWAPVADGAGLGFTTAALAEDVVLVGAASLDLELKSSAPDTDIQVTLSDVRPDGQEMFVQSGWLRASHRALDASLSTESNPVQTHLEEDAADLPAGTFETVRVQIHPSAYAFRAGHRIRITIQAPGGERPSWTFATIEDGSIENTIQLGTSKLVLPVVSGSAGAPMPPCPSNRGMPCRAYAPASNGG